MSNYNIWRGCFYLVLIGAWAGCLDLEDEATSGDAGCVCSGEGVCPEEVCDVQLRLPAACGEEYEQAQINIGQGEPVSFQPSELFTSCEQTLSVGESASLTLVLGQGEVTYSGMTAECETGGERVSPHFCTLQFELGESCRGVHDTAVIVIEGEEVGEAQLDKAFSPCLLLIQDQEVVTAMRAGTDLIVGQTFTCNQHGELRHILECP